MISFHYITPEMIHTIHSLQYHVTPLTRDPGVINLASASRDDLVSGLRQLAVDESPYSR